MSDWGFDFRSTLGFVTDPANCYPVLGETFPHTYAAGVSAGFVSPGSLNLVNGSAGVDARLAGCIFENNSPFQMTFRVTLPATGTYTIDVVCGDVGYAESNMKVEVFDTGSSLGVLMTGASTASSSRWVDTDGTDMTEATWLAGHTTVDKTFTTTECNFKIGNLVTYTKINHIRVTSVAGGPSAGTDTATAGLTESLNTVSVTLSIQESG